MTTITKVQAGWKVEAVGATGWLTRKEYDDVIAAFEANGIVNEIAVDDVWMMYVDARWNRRGKFAKTHDEALAGAIRWNAMMMGKVSIEEYEASE